MKKTLGILLAVIIFTIPAWTQTTGTLTNNDVVRLVKASLPDELIVEFIRSSPVQFDLSREATTGLSGSGVSAVVVEAMRTAESNRGAGAKEMKALGYVAAMKVFIPFYTANIKELEEKIRGWDSEMRSSLLKARELNTQIRALEADLRLKKSQDPLKFSKEIVAAKKNLSENREKYQKMKEKMISDGEKITKEIASFGGDKSKALGKQYGEAGQQVKSMNGGPEAGEKPVSLSFPKFSMNENVVDYLKPVTELYYWHQNALDRIAELAESWNPKVSDMVAKDAGLAELLKPLQEQLEELKVDPKKNKGEISVAKKKISDLEKKRKQLSDQMESDSKGLASALNEAGSQLQEALEERFSDIVANIEYSFKEPQF